MPNDVNIPYPAFLGSQIIRLSKWSQEQSHTLVNRQSLIHDNVIDNEVMGWSNLFWKRKWIYVNGSNMNRRSFYYR
jgi:hypothetical protein